MVVRGRRGEGAPPGGGGGATQFERSAEAFLRDGDSRRRVMPGPLRDMRSVSLLLGGRDCVGDRILLRWRRMRGGG